MKRTESQLPKQPMLHDSLYCQGNPKGSFTVKVDSSDRLAYDSARVSPTGDSSEPKEFKNTTEQLLDKLSDKGLKSVKSHAQLAKTAHGVRILAKNLNKATIHLQLQSVMIITKARDNSLVYLTKEMAEWLLSISETTEVYVDYHLENSKRFDPPGILNDIPNAKGRLKFWTKSLIRSNPDIFDLVITLGGDGTVLYASTLFQRVVPPIMSFSLGSLGFLTNFQFENFRNVLANVIKNGVHTNLRMRFTCRVHKANGELVCEQQVLNELTVDRGPSPWVSMLEMYGDGSLITVAQADGLIIATPTGSTAYSLSAGGSLVHPSVSAISVTPICPHTLSFRPILLPDSMNLRVKVPLRSRATAWASFDGRSRVELLKGHYVTVCASPFPFPTVRSSKTEYFDSVSRVLNWNNREEQKGFIHLLSDKNKKSYTTYQKRHGSNPESDLEDEDHLNKNLIFSNTGSTQNSPATSTNISSGVSDGLSEITAKHLRGGPSKLKNMILNDSDEEEDEDDVDDDEQDEDGGEADEEEEETEEITGNEEEDGFEIDYNEDEEQYDSNTPCSPTNSKGGSNLNGVKDLDKKSKKKTYTYEDDSPLSENMSDSTIDIDDNQETQSNYFFPHPSEEIRTPALGTTLKKI
ncbi:hypothetical protein CANARDRAFT_173651 [[Candida] arabinofermentans NRRL YB-2248]|uniref:NAD+ kinase n=1 Tax=[Candida] arabinofermentans NRRL YB-2248 TaxID=983967 RepID=A0A1E4T7K5_9ASCO|nr:hypothetical protein CANARDRAFT_173651 [[Candida] arabinofermentans NRRL YB-2248]